MNPCCSTIHGVFSVPPLNTPPKIPSRVFFYALILPALVFIVKIIYPHCLNHPLSLKSQNPNIKNRLYVRRFTSNTKNRPYAEFIISNLVGICGLEPQTSSLSVTRSNQLSYIPNTSPFYPIYSEKSISNLD